MPDSNGVTPTETLEKVARAETTSRPKREYRTLAFQVALFSALGAFAVLTLMVTSTPFFAIDLQITRALQTIRSPVFAGFMYLISWPGYPPQGVILPAVITLTMYRLGFRWEAVTALLAAIFSALVNVLIKELIARPRPTVDLVDVFSILDSYSFPSGHVMLYLGFYGFLWFLVFSLLKRSWMRTFLLILLGALVGLVGVSRIYLGQHWASDILGAVLLGGLLLVLILEFYRWGKKRFFVNQPVAPG